MTIAKEVVSGDDLGKALGIDPVLKKVDVRTDDVTIHVNGDNKLEVIKSGLDCDAIDQLPEEPWKKGTTVLAKQDGKCIRLTALDSIFQEVGVGITANKLSAFTDDKFEVVVTVSNTGEGRNDLTNLAINKPNSNDFTIEDITVTHQGVQSYQRTGELSYDIHGLEKGGTFVVRYKVVPRVAGTFQFTASVNPNTSLDLNGKNNTATLVLSAQTKQNPSYVPSVDCPLVTATELASNVVLVQAESRIINDQERVVLADDKCFNVMADRQTLRGLRIRLDGVSTVVGYRTSQGDGMYSMVLSDGNVTHGVSVIGDYGTHVYVDAAAEKKGTDGYTFTNGVLEITADVAMFAFSCRPAGNNCKWQTYKIVATVQPKARTIKVTNAQFASVRKETIFSGEKRSAQELFQKTLIVPAAVTYDHYRYLEAYAARDRLPTADEKLIIDAYRGLPTNVTYESTDNYADVSVAQGKTNITPGHVTVDMTATPTDSVNTKYVQVIIQ